MAPCPTGLKYPCRPTELYRMEGWICGNEVSKKADRSPNPSPMLLPVGLTLYGIFLMSLSVDTESVAIERGIRG